MDRLNAASGIGATVTTGASGSFFAQIRNGAPFDVFLSADTSYPRALADAGITLQESVFYGGTSDASAVHLVRDGIPTGVINIARRYSHSPVETLDLDDAVDALLLLEAAVRAYNVGTDFGFLAADWG